MSTPAYQVVARHQDGTVIEAALADAPLHFGAADSVNLRLTGVNIPPVAGRIVRAGAARVMLSNLNAASGLTLNGVPVPTGAPQEWRPGARLTLGAYTLELTTAAPRDLTPETLAPRYSPDAPPSAPEAPPEEATAAPVIRPAAPPPSIPEAPPAEATAPPAAPRAAPPSVPEFTQFMRVVNEPPINTGDPVTELYRGVPPAEPEADAEGFTRVKDWHAEGRLSAQLGLSTINFAPGERIRLPVYVRNEYLHPVELLVNLVGLPANWTIEATPLLTLPPGDLKTLDVSIQTQPVDGLERLDGALRLYDHVTPEITLHLPLKLVLKRQPDLLGRCEPPVAREGTPVFLTLQNLTRSPMTVALSVREQSPALRVRLPQAQLELMPNQTRDLRLEIQVRRRAVFRRQRSGFRVFAQQGTRAPLDIPGVVIARPRLPLWLLLLIAALAAGLGIAAGVLLLPTAARLFAPPTVTPTATATATITPPASPSATVTSRPTDIPTPTPTVLPLLAASPVPPFDDPRTAGCQNRVSAPAGWQTAYTVVRGDNLYRLGLRFQTSADEIARVNCIAGARIFAGQTLLVPGE